MRLRQQAKKVLRQVIARDITTLGLGIKRVLSGGVGLRVLGSWRSGVLAVIVIASAARATKKRRTVGNKNLTFGKPQDSLLGTLGPDVASIHWLVPQQRRIHLPQLYS